MMFSSTSFAEWTKVDSDGDGNNFYIDFDRIRKHDGYVYYWLLMDFPKPFTELNLLSSKQYRQTDCKAYGFKILSFIYHEKSMGRDKGVEDEPVDKNWHYPQPNTFDEKFVDLVCR